MVASFIENFYDAAKLETTCVGVHNCLKADTRAFYGAVLQVQDHLADVDRCQADGEAVARLIKEELIY